MLDMHTDSLPPSDRMETPEPPPQALPKGPKPPKAANAEIRGRFAEWIKESGFSRVRAAQQIGYSPTAVSLYLAGTYGADCTELERKIVDMLDAAARRNVAVIPTVQCETAQQIRDAIELVRRTNDVGLIVGDSGVGKTRGAELYASQTPTAMLLRVREWSKDQRSVESALFDLVGDGGWDRRTKRALWIIGKLRGANRPLIVDDAHKLTVPALRYLFDLHDETQLPLALLGTAELEERVKADPQRFGRVGYRRPIGAEAPEVVIDLILSTLAPTTSPSERTKARMICEQIAAKAGALRAVLKEVRLAAELCGRRPSLGLCDALRAAHTRLVRDYNLD